MASPIGPHWGLGPRHRKKMLTQAVKTANSTPQARGMLRGEDRATEMFLQTVYCVYLYSYICNDLCNDLCNYLCSYLCNYLCNYLCIYLSIYRSIYLSYLILSDLILSISILSIYLSIYPHLSMYLSIYLSVYFSIYVFMMCSTTRDLCVDESIPKRDDPAITSNCRWVVGVSKIWQP